jgi:lipopolysaccharide transport system permease protein
MNKKIISNWGSHSGRSDIWTAFSAPHVWLALGWHDIKQRYRRSVIGPFWFTLSTLIMVGALGLVYSTLMGQNLREYIPYLGLGLVVWQYISTVINEGTTAFINNGYLIKQVRMPLTVYAMRVVWCNFIILLHSLPIVILLTIILGKTPKNEALFLFPGLLILMLQGVWVVLVVGIICCRFRDVIPIVNNFISIAFFVTPVLWPAKDLKERDWIADLNPLYHTIQIIRGPIMGTPVYWQSWAYSVGLLIAGFILAQYLMCRCRHRVAYWL